jgi:hypothetical protein
VGSNQVVFAVTERTGIQFKLVQVTSRSRAGARGGLREIPAEARISARLGASSSSAQPIRDGLTRGRSLGAVA